MTSTVQIHTFIPLKSHYPIINRLDHAVSRKGICTFFGPFSCGKSSLMDYWLRIRERPADAIQPNQTLCIRLRPAPERQFPMVCMVYSRLWHRLQQLDQPSYLTSANERINHSESDIKVHNSRQLQSLLLKLIDRANRRNIRAVVIDNAHFLDKDALEWLMDLRAYYDEQEGFVPRRAIVLVGRSDLPEGERMLRNLERIDEALPAWKNLRLEMKHMNRGEFIEAFALLIGQNLQATFHPELSPQEKQREVVELWKRAGGTLGKKETGETTELTGAHWRAVEELIVDLDETLGPWDGTRLRVITREILEQVKGRWTPA